jgi:phage gpG-like protein
MSQTVQGLKELIARVQEIQRNAKNLRRPLKEAADYQLESLDRNFEAGGRPPWKLLATGGVSHLDQSGAMRGSNKPVFSSDGWEIVNTDPKSEWHLLGTKNKDDSERMPARDWMVFQEEDAGAIVNIFGEHILS